MNYPETGPSYASPCYRLMIPFSLVAAPYGFSTGGYVEGFLRDWWNAWVASGDIVEMAEGYRLGRGDPDRALGNDCGPEVNKPA